MCLDIYIFVSQCRELLLAQTPHGVEVAQKSMVEDGFSHNLPLNWQCLTWRSLMIWPTKYSIDKPVQFTVSIEADIYIHVKRSSPEVFVHVYFSYM